MNAYLQAAQQAAPLLGHYKGPLGVLGKLVGLGQAEIEAGVPWWAWASVGFLAGGAVAYSLRHKLESIVES